MIKIFLSDSLLQHIPTCTSDALFVLPHHNCITFSKKALALLRMTALVKVPSMDDDRAQNKALRQSDKAMQYMYKWVIFQIMIRMILRDSLLLHIPTCNLYALFILNYSNCITLSKKAFALLRMTAFVKVCSVDHDRVQNKPLRQSDQSMQYN